MPCGDAERAAIEQTVPLEMRMVVEIIMATHAGMTTAESEVIRNDAVRRAARAGLRPQSFDLYPGQ
jgi:hypothetical protein